MRRLPLILPIVALLGATASSPAQTAPAQQAPSPADQKSAPATNCPNPASPDSKLCPPPAADTRPAAKRFPFPGESSSAPADAPSAAAPSAPAPNTPATNNAHKQFPYPGEAPSPDDASSSSSSSSSSSAADPTDNLPPDPDKPKLDDKGSSGASTRRLLPKVARLSPEERAEEDLSVAKYYRQAGNLQAAYLRCRDAVAQQPDDPEAHFQLADVANKLNKHDEALAEFSAYLKLEPDGDHVKAAQKALASLK